MEIKNLNRNIANFVFKCKPFDISNLTCFLVASLVRKSFNIDTVDIFSVLKCASPLLKRIRCKTH